MPRGAKIALYVLYSLCVVLGIANLVLLCIR